MGALAYVARVGGLVPGHVRLAVIYGRLVVAIVGFHILEGVVVFGHVFRDDRYYVLDEDGALYDRHDWVDEGVRVHGRGVRHAGRSFGITVVVFHSRFAGAGVFFVRHRTAYAVGVPFRGVGFTARVYLVDVGSFHSGFRFLHWLLQVGRHFGCDRVYIDDHRGPYVVVEQGYYGVDGAALRAYRGGAARGEWFLYSAAGFWGC